MYYVDCERFPQRIMTLSAFVRVGAKLDLFGPSQNEYIQFVITFEKVKCKGTKQVLFLGQHLSGL